MTVLQEKVEAIQSSRNEVSNSRHESNDEKEDGDGGLIQLTETTKTFLEAAFLGTMTNADRKKGVKKIGVPDCNQVCCPKLDGVLKAKSRFAQGCHKGGPVSVASPTVMVGSSGSPCCYIRKC